MPPGGATAVQEVVLERQEETKLDENGTHRPAVVETSEVGGKFLFVFTGTDFNFSQIIQVLISFGIVLKHLWGYTHKFYTIHWSYFWIHI